MAPIVGFSEAAHTGSGGRNRLIGGIAPRYLRELVTHCTEYAEGGHSAAERADVRKFFRDYRG
ncbi:MULTISPECIES: hypothetical protein [Nocardia]|uniref:hypothetical protein n=1 Tax=Nocardia TaxID=1817 RepID=UPI00245563C3|nr:MULTISPECIES: hypothetical protein [Nocardia]